jgi:anti-sigma B factor antagonist
MGLGALNITITESGPSSVVHLEGELDLANAPELSEAMDSVRGSRERVIVDVTDLEFIDSTGLRLLVVHHGHSIIGGFEFVIAGANADVSRTMRMAGLDVTLPLAPDLATALGDEGGAGQRPGSPSPCTDAPRSRGTVASGRGGSLRCASPAAAEPLGLGSCASVRQRRVACLMMRRAPSPRGDLRR